MNESSEFCTIDQAESLQPQIPGSDDPGAASTVLNEVLTSAAALAEELRAIADRHATAAPASADHVLDLSSALARAVLDWIARWPS